VATAGMTASCKDCGGSGGAGPAASGSASASAAPSSGASAAASAGATASAEPAGSRRAGMRGMRGAGPVAMLVHVAKGLELKDEQKPKVEEIEKKLHTDDPTARDAAKELRSALISGIKAGKIDKAKVDAQEATLEKAAKQQHDKDIEALS